MAGDWLVSDVDGTQLLCSLGYIIIIIIITATTILIFKDH